MAIILDGKVVAKAIKNWLSSSVSMIEKRYGWTPSFVTVQVGNDPASDRYIRNQIKLCCELGMNAELIQFPSDISKDDFMKRIKEIENDDNVDGIIIQRPLPEGWTIDEIIRSVSPVKDVEGIHPENLGCLFLGQESIPHPCTAWAAILLLEWYGRDS
ncbi:MAG: bifunctional 5,10-methylenetetrahydrofolate dehydrogenase/5,10-methenyltetrahydrofolate cyclohydrolase, partial [Synergistaceae bacterium]|nr:bifunctional 5,10-methylenetetrahydrofolate dehydrogenase/5,10-methenyltetrahydrofolate cyclohydrolase [Synergistaceae bacterium]